MSNEVVYSYKSSVGLTLPNEQSRSASRAISDAHGYAWSMDDDAPEPVRDAHYRLHTTQMVHIIVDVYADGTKRMRLP